MSDIKNDFILQKEIGYGSYATVYVAKSLEDDKYYAVKQIKKEVVCKSSRSIDAIANEIYVMKNLEHPGCLKLYRVYECQSSISLVLDYIQGGELFKRILRRGKYSEKSASEFVKNLL
jgi:serine/threonine protein kinase